MGSVSKIKLTKHEMMVNGLHAENETSQNVPEDIANTIAETVDPMIDLQANADYRRQLVRVLGARVLMAAFTDATRQREAA